VKHYAQHSITRSRPIEVRKYGAGERIIDFLTEGAAKIHIALDEDLWNNSTEREAKWAGR
jgi:hypothetical protein